MRPVTFSTDPLRQFLRRKRIATLPQLKQVLGTDADITVFRKLKELSYHTSYSHRGQFYTLAEIPDFDENGLWTYDSAGFSRRGTLLNTSEAFVNQAPAGYFAGELEELLHVPVKEPLLHLVRQDRIGRREISHMYLYCASDNQRRDRGPELPTARELLRQARPTRRPPTAVTPPLRQRPTSSYATPTQGAPTNCSTRTAAPRQPTAR